MPFNMKPKNYTPHGVNMVRFGEKRPLLEIELNELQQNFIQMSAENIRQSTFTGFLQMNNFGGYVKPKQSDNINKFFLTDFQEKVDIINLDGYTMPLRNSAGHGDIQIDLPEPPTSGVENNLVFLEFWNADVSHEKPIYRYGNVDNEIEDIFKIDPRIGIETTRRTQLRWRIRTIRDVDFNIYPKGVTDPRVVAIAEAELKTSEYRFKPMENDPFIYRAGEETQKAKEDLRTIDGYVYAVPLFRVKRRNSSGFTEVNPNGAIKFDGALSDRPDGLFADVIDQRDIVDLRNKISLNGFNYDKLLHQEFDKFLRTENGELALSKTYHGIPHTPSENKVFLATFDGSSVAEIGGQTNVTNDRFVPTPTGLGTNLEGAEATPTPITGVNKAEGEITLLVNFDTVSKFEQTGYVSILDDNDNPVFQLLNNGRYIVGEADGGNGKIEFKQHLLGYHYVTLAWKDPLDGSMGKLELYIDGNLQQSRGYKVGTKVPSKIILGYGSVLGHLQYNNSVTVSDISISNKYECTFPNMPKDFKLGFANLAPKFNRQRRIFGEGQVSQGTVGRVKATGTEHSAGISKTQATNGTWKVGDVIAVKGIGGEIISGIVDERAVRVRITESTEDSENPSSIIAVANTVEFSIGEKIRIWRMETNQVSKEYTIAEVDTENFTITLNENALVVGGSYIIDSTFTDSVPLVKAVKSITDNENVTGTWVGLGSPEAEFTITSIPVGYESEDISVLYSLNTPSKQRGLPEVLNVVHEANLGEEILIPQRTFAIFDDFKGKIVGSDIENPNRTLYLESMTLGNVEDFLPSTQFVYDNVSEKDGITVTAEASTPDHVPQRLFEFDLIKIIEQKFGKEIPDVDKLEWFKRNVESIEFKWNGYGASPTGNKASLAIQDNELRTWVSYINHTDGNIKELSLMVSGLSYDKMIDPEGKIRFIAYAEPAVNAEQISTIYTDYASIELILRKRDNYDFLVPVSYETRKISLINPTPPENIEGESSGGVADDWKFKEFISRNVNRRDYEISNLLLVQKQTKTVETMFEANPEELFVTYGSYVPVADNVQTVEEVTILAEAEGLLLSDVSSESAQVLGNHHWSNPLYRVRNDNRSLTGDIGFDTVQFTADSRKVNVGAYIVLNGVGPLNYFTRQYAELKEPLQAVGIARFLVMHNHELKLWICSLHPNGRILDLDRSEVSILIPLQGNPVVKEEEGIKRTNILPTTWRTESGEVRGYFDEFGNFIATYQ